MTDKTTGIFTISSRKGLNYADEREREFVEYTIKREREVLIADMIQKLRPNIPHTIILGDVVEKVVADPLSGWPVVELRQRILVAVSDFRDTEVGDACLAEPLALDKFYYAPRRDDTEEWEFLYEEDYVIPDRFGDSNHLSVWRRIK